MPEDNTMNNTAKMRAWVQNGGKKKLAAHGTTAIAGASGGSLATIVLIGQLFGPLSGLAAIPELQKKADTVVTVAAKMENIEKNQDRLETKLDKLLDLQIQNMQKQGQSPRIEKDVIVDYYTPDKDRTSSYWKRGAAADTLMVPVAPVVSDTAKSPR